MSFINKLRRPCIFLSTLLFLLPVFPLRSQERALESRTSLNGTWNFSIHGRGQKAVAVPSTYLPVGAATLERNFEVATSSSGRRALLRFEGFAAAAQVRVNDKKVGESGPYAPFSVDVTNVVHMGTNSVRVEMNDLDGPMPWTRDWIPAFPKFGGIIRDVYIEWKPTVYIGNAKLDYRLSENYSKAECQLQVWIVNSGAGPARIQLSAQLGLRGDAQTVQSEITAPSGESQQTLHLTVPKVKVWSPDSPTLYQLEVRAAGAVEDRFAFETGFREFVARGQEFFLNGKPFFIKGIFRHDMYGNQGHTLTPAEMESDIADIKSLGANFIRLGHYPHDKRIVDLAARYGLLASEEPPIFALSQTDPVVVEVAKNCLGKTIRRDWNNPAVVVWFLSNEVGTNLGYMTEMASFVRGVDASRLVGIVDNTKWTAENAPWPNFRTAKIDFIAQNAYGSGLDGSYDKLATMLPNDLPYLISEWGGTSDAYDNVLKEGEFYLAHSTLNLKSGPRIAGISFWEYADINSARWSAEGVLHWSVTDKFRRPYETYYAVKSLYTGTASRPPVGRRLPEATDEVLPRKIAPFEKQSGYDPVDLSGVVNSDAVLSDLKPVSGLAYPADLTLGRVAIAGLPFELGRQVILLSEKHPEVRLPIGKAASEIFFLGQVCFNGLTKKPADGPAELPFLTELGAQAEFPPPLKAYPFAGEFGEVVAEYVIEYEDGQKEVVKLQNGIHFADYRTFFSFSFIEPVATDTKQAVLYKGDFGAKKYQLRLFAYRPARVSERISSIDFRLDGAGYMPLLVAVTLKQ